MATLKCKACGGVYDDVLPDGMRYFHVCPPLTRQRVTRHNGALELVDSRMTTTIDKDRDGNPIVVRTFKPALPAGSTWLEEVGVLRPDHRDENAPSTREEDAGKVTAAGAGVVEVKA
jgi:hypothetical protein